MSDKTPADVLREAADVVRTKGWCRFTLTDKEGRRCAAGAIFSAADTLGCSADRELAYDALFSTLPPGRGDNLVNCIADWNDRLALDGEDVAVHMEKAAIRWEETAGLTEGSGRRL